MSADFWIQASCPKWTTKASQEDDTLCDAIQTIFPLDTEVALLVWRNVYVPLNYKYCVSFLVDDIIAMIDQLMGAADGRWKLEWPSNDFAATWEFQWHDDHLEIDTQWRVVVGGTEDLLRQRPKLEISLAAFLGEWTKLLVTVLEALRAAGYDEATLPRLKQLAQGAAKVGRVGKIYQ